MDKSQFALPGSTVARLREAMNSLPPSLMDEIEIDVRNVVWAVVRDAFAEGYEEGARIESLAKLPEDDPHRQLERDVWDTSSARLRLVE